MLLDAFPQPLRWLVLLGGSLFAGRTAR